MNPFGGDPVPVPECFRAAAPPCLPVCRSPVLHSGYCAVCHFEMKSWRQYTAVPSSATHDRRVTRMRSSSSRDWFGPARPAMLRLRTPLSLPMVPDGVARGDGPLGTLQAPTKGATRTGLGAASPVVPTPVLLLTGFGGGLRIRQPWLGGWEARWTELTQRHGIRIDAPSVAPGSAGRAGPQRIPRPPGGKAHSIALVRWRCQGRRPSMAPSRIGSGGHPAGARREPREWHRGIAGPEPEER